MNIDTRYAKLVSDQTGVLATSTTKAAQRIFGHVMATLHGNEFNGVSHIGDRDLNEAFCDLFR